MADLTDTTSVSPRKRERRAAVARVGLVIGIGVVCFLLGVYVTSKDVANLRSLLASVQTETQKARQALASQVAVNSSLQARLASVSADLEAIRPQNNLFNIPPNQSIVLAGGRLTLGLVGSPGNSNVMLNVNGEQRKAASGDVIQVPAGVDMTCRIAVQGFDLFKVLLNVNCGKGS